MRNCGVYQLLELNLSLHLVIKYRLRDVHELNDSVLAFVVNEVALLYLDEPKVVGFLCVVSVLLPEFLFGTVDLMLTQNNKNLLFEEFLVLHQQQVFDGKVLLFFKGLLHIDGILIGL